MTAADGFLPLRFGVLTVSDSRTEADDTSGHYLVNALQAGGHELADKRILTDDLYQVRARVAWWIAEPGVDVALITGGTGMTGRDITPQALQPLLDRDVDGFGELFRYLSFQEIGTATVQSRAFAGLANGTLVFALPGSTGACRTAWEGILAEQLDARHRPCNFATLLPRFSET
jgi:molybdenum cofactor biosynthesis protein B